ncbi:putative signal transducing protein [Cesiribacter andamanensis]|uniref:DUF2007 domain-containing protein n=1 Tax=Cesiribacter andamanensis AMV16 TaxID=1279009 RepID=M7NXE2_9BACT|nr:DUF2007 domain-containing protein [Cesiribacter andamanensis]EMR03094.1 hypothetical protein ADICEAN_01753 [Cesiribacter andamanensis AMV16]
MEDKNTISIFQGPAVEADAIHDFLAQNNIGSLVRNHMQENLDAGWVTAAPDFAAEVFVSRQDEPQARDLMRNVYLQGNTDRPAAHIPPQPIGNKETPTPVRPQNPPLE